MWITSRRRRCPDLVVWPLSMIGKVPAMPAATRPNCASSRSHVSKCRRRHLYRTTEAAQAGETVHNTICKGLPTKPVSLVR